MKFISRDNENNEISLIPNSADDLYQLYNVIMVDDWVSTKTSRRVKEVSGGSESGKRTSVTIKVKVENTEFHGFGDVIRVKGKIVEASDSMITMGNYHTLKISLFKEVFIKKKIAWSKFDIQSLENSFLGIKTGILLVAIDDESAIISLVGTHATKILLEMLPTIPRKSSDVKQHLKGMYDFFNDLTKFLLEKIGEFNLDQIFIGGPGFTKDEYYDFVKENYANILSKIVIKSIPSSGRSGISELIRNELPEHLDEVKVLKIQTNLVNTFLDHIGKNTGKIAYGSLIDKATELGAVEHLLILDSKMRGSVKDRNSIIKLIDLVEQNRGKVHIVSELHEIGELLKGFTGLIAILRFKLPTF